MLIVAIILSIIVGIGVAYYIVAKQVSKSNNYGDSVGELRNFDNGSWRLMGRRDYGTKQKEWSIDKNIRINQRNGLDI